MMEQPPFRLCCGERHYGPQCPDGLVMCCICFLRYQVEALSKDEDGNHIDVCIKCSNAVKAIARAVYKEE